MRYLYFVTKPICLDGSTDARPSRGQDGVHVAAARKPWRRPELKVLAVEETKTGFGLFGDGPLHLLHS
jgi:hypothetical protein